MKKNDILIDYPTKDDNCEILRSNVVSIQVCSCLSEAETLKWLRRESPAGTRSNWESQRKGDADYKAPVQCADDPDRTHYIFIC
jgi:hypothetical protein